MEPIYSVSDVDYMYVCISVQANTTMDAAIYMFNEEEAIMDNWLVVFSLLGNSRPLTKG